MANVDIPRGMAPLRSTTGGTRFEVNEYVIDVSDSTLITKGDIVDQEADGNITRAAPHPG